MKKSFILFFLGILLSYKVDAGVKLVPESNTNDVRILKECPEEYPLRGKNGSCYSCSETYEIEIDSDVDCGACQNRKTYKNLGGQKTCVLKSCPAVAPIFYDGDCLPCYTREILDVTQEECRKCENSAFKRRYVSKGTKIDTLIVKNSGCYLEKDFDNTENKIYSVPFEAINGVEYLNPDSLVGYDMPVRKNYISEQNFHSCESDLRIQTLPEICKRCPSRYYDYESGECRLYHEPGY